MEIQEGKAVKTGTLALLTAAAFAASGSLPHNEIITDNELDRIVYNLPEGVEIERIPARLGFCGDTAAVVMDEYGYQIWCGEYTFMHPELERDGCYLDTLARRIMLTDIKDEWTDINCDGAAEYYYSGQEDFFVAYSDYLLLQRIESFGMQPVELILENAARFVEAAEMYAMILFDMNKGKAERLWGAFKARHSRRGN